MILRHFSCKRIYSLFFVVAAIAEYSSIGKLLSTVSSPIARRSASRLRITAAGAMLWPAFVLAFFECSPAPLAYVGGLLVLAYLIEESRVLGNFHGPSDDFERIDRFDQRASTIGTFVFALGTIIHNQHFGEASSEISPAIFTSLALCCFASLTFSKDGRNSSPEYSSVQKLLLSYSAGFLCLAVLQCISLPRR